MALLDFGRLMRAAGQTIQGLPENATVRGGLSLMAANQRGQTRPVDQPGSFLKGMLQANSLKQNRLALEEAAKEKARQEAMRIQREQARAALIATLPPQQRLMYSALGDNPDVIKSMIASQNPQPPKYENVQMDKVGNAYGVNMSTGQFGLIPTGQTMGQTTPSMPTNAGEVVDAMPTVNNVSGSATGFVAKAPLTENERRLQDLQFKNEKNKFDDRETEIAEKQEKIRFGTVDNAQKAIRSADAVYGIQKILQKNPEGGFFDAGPTGTSSQLLGWKGGTAARDVKALLGTIYASFGFKTLADMKAASPGGGALGAINKSEMDLLIASVIALDPSMSRSLFQDQLGKVVTHYNSLIASTPPDILETLNTGPLQSNQFVPNVASPTGYTIMPQDVVDTKNRTEDGGIIGSTSDGQQKVYY